MYDGSKVNYLTEGKLAYKNWKDTEASWEVDEKYGASITYLKKEDKLLIYGATESLENISEVEGFSGGNATYFTLDGGTKTIEVSVPINVGVDDTGHDVKFFAATAGSYMLWDESHDRLHLTDSTPIYIGDSGGETEDRSSAPPLGPVTAFLGHTSTLYFAFQIHFKSGWT